MRKLLFLGVSVVLLVWLAAPASAQRDPISEIAESIDATGRFVEGDLSAADVQAIDEANDSGIAFVWLARANTSDEDAANVAAEVNQLLSNSQYQTVLVVLDNGGDVIGVGADSSNRRGAEDASNAAGPVFFGQTKADGVTVFTETLLGLEGSRNSSDGADNPNRSTTGEVSNNNEGSGGIGFLPLLLILGVLGGGAFLAFKAVRGRSKAKKVAAQDIAADRNEIQEQLKDNADRVISLGDDVIASKDSELIKTYEEASTAYQEVSTSLASAHTADVVDALDDKIDKAEWQFDVIEAKLAGRPAPVSPAEREREQREQEQQQANNPSPQDRVPSNDKPALGPDESIVSGGRTPSGRQTRSRHRGGRPGGGLGGGRRPGGGFGGGLGGGLGGMLGSILMGGTMGGRRPSRRTRRRRMGAGSIGSPGGFNDPFGGSSRRKPRRSSGGSRGGGSFGGKRGGSKGGGSFSGKRRRR